MFISDLERVRLLATERAEDFELPPKADPPLAEIQVQYLGALLRNGSCYFGVIPCQLCYEEPLLKVSHKYSKKTLPLPVSQGFVVTADTFDKISFILPKAGQ